LPEASLNQGAIEKIFLDDLSEHGVVIDRLVRPTSLELSSDKKLLEDLNAYAVTATLEHIQAVEEDKITETIYAKFVIGADGQMFEIIANFRLKRWQARTLGSVAH
jgi:phenol 2-monooxygenase (NADPH)